MMNLKMISVALALSAFAAVGCNDPAKGKTVAETAEAVAAPTGQKPADALTYAFDQTTSKLDWAAAKVSLKHDGGFKAFAGTIHAPPGAPEKGTVEVTIDTRSVWSDTERLTKHLMSGDFFEVEKFPQATFTSTKLTPGGAAGASHTVTGNLSLHGVTKSVSFPARIRVGQDEAEVDAEFAIDRKDFGIVYPGKPDDLINDKVTIKLQIRAKRANRT